MQKKNKKIIIGIIIIAIIILLILSLNVIKQQNKNKLNLAENTPNNAITTELNIPVVSAGMIPVKLDGGKWIITTKDDSDWYDYSQGKPAYIMLNDGYYRSELERGITDDQLMQNNAGVGVPDDPSIRGTIFMWIPRFVYNDAGEIGYIKEETTLGEGWTVPDLFMYKTADETKPDFSLGGVWLQKDVDTAYSTKMAQMNQEESIYGFLANTVGVGVPDDPSYKDTIQMYINNVGADASVRPMINDPANPNRIILKIINSTKHEPIKANITHNTVDKKIEIKVTYTSNGISKIINEYGEVMPLTKDNGVILSDTGTNALGTGTYYFTVIDNKGNKQELSITPNVDSLFKVAYINGTDNMDINATYKKTQETVSSSETTLLNQIKATDTRKTFDRAIQDTNKAITAIGQQTRTADDEQMYMYEKYDANKTPVYSITKSNSFTYVKVGQNFSGYTGYSNYSINSNGIVLSGDARNMSCYYDKSDLKSGSKLSTTTVTSSFYYFEYIGPASGLSKGYWEYNRYNMNVKRDYKYSRGDFVSNIIALDGTYTIGSSSAVHSDGYWYTRTSLAPKYTLYKYDSDLTLKSTYDVDTKTLLTETVNISNKGNNKVKLTLNTTGTGHKTYISNDNTNWQEVTDITSGTPKELDVDGWNSLYIKIETNTSRINNIDIAYYKD